MAERGESEGGIARRTVIAGGTAALTVTALTPGIAAARPGRAPETDPVVRTTAGALRGTRNGAVSVFRGIPYAQPPVGPLRFSSPRPPKPWQGVRDAVDYGPTAIQFQGTEGQEDCLYANVWTPGTRGARPVLVFIHGGGWQSGAGSLPNYESSRLAERGDLVVVTFNYRLGAFGWGLHEEFADRSTGSIANWGLQDQAAALRWLRANAAAFGGDPDNITVSGGSAGGATTWQLGLLPQTRPLIRRIIPISPAHIWTPAAALTPQDARRAYELVARDLGVTVSKLREVPAYALRDSWEKLFAGPPADRPLASGRAYRGPVVDGEWMRGPLHRLPLPELPTLSINTDTEGSFYTGPNPPTPAPAPTPTDEASLRVAVRAVLIKGAAQVTDAEVDACIAAYRAAALADGLPHDPLSLWTEIWGDGLFRYLAVRLAEKQARAGVVPQYRMEFAHPVRAPWFGTPHEATSKFLFGSFKLPANAPQYGDGPLEETVSNAFMDLVASFAHTGAPAVDTVRHWPVFDPARATALRLGGPDVARLVTTSKARQLSYWDTAGWGPRP